MKLAVTIDVEEEGLFSGRYDPYHAPVNNVSRLAVLDPIFREFEIHPTLMVSYQVAHSKEHHDLILRLNDKWKGEIGAHLHTWNTPPLRPLPYPAPVPSELISRELLSAKMDTLLKTLKSIGTIPVSFRMGRFNMGPKMLSVLEQAGIQVDSSIAPTRNEYGGPSHLSAPTDPYFPDPANPSSPGKSHILEVPLTILPLVPNLGYLLERLGNSHIIPLSAIAWFSKYLGSVYAQPVGMGIRRLKTAVKLHHIRGGRVITIFFHSSDLMPGVSPSHPTDRDVKKFLEKLMVFFSWLHSEIGVKSLTLSELCRLYPKSPLSANSMVRH